MPKINLENVICVVLTPFMFVMFAISLLHYFMQDIIDRIFKTNA